MAQLVRQIGVVIGLTLILTFPVTVVSGAGSQKQSEHVVRFTAGVKGQAVMVGAMPGSIRPASVPLNSPRQGER